MDIISKDAYVKPNAKIPDADYILNIVLEENKEAIEDILRNQLRHSQTGEGLTPEYSEAAQVMKDKSSYEGVWPHWDLYNTGEFLGSIKATIANGGIIFSAPENEKEGYLYENIGDALYMLNEESWNLVYDIIFPEFYKKVLTFI